MSRFARIARRNYDEGLRQRPVIGNAEIDTRLMAWRRQRLQPGQSSARQLHGRTATRQVHHPHIPPPDATPDSGAERLGTGFLGGKSLGVGRHHHLLAFRPARGPGALGFGENAVEKAVAVTLDDFGHAPDVDQVGADADDHVLPTGFSCSGISLARILRPRSIAARIARTVSPRPTNNASPIM